eukprot:6676569-Ditylum_brightwellii.AAC.1
MLAEREQCQQKTCMVWQNKEIGLAACGGDEEESHCRKEYLLVTRDINEDDVWNFNDYENTENNGVTVLEADDCSEASSWVKDIEEYGLVGKDAKFAFTNNAKILHDLNVFIGDTGATTDTTNSQFGFKNTRKANA